MNIDYNSNINPISNLISNLEIKKSNIRNLEIKKENMKNMELKMNEIMNYINSLHPLTLKSQFIAKLKNNINDITINL